MAVDFQHDPARHFGGNRIGGPFGRSFDICAVDSAVHIQPAVIVVAPAARVPDGDADVPVGESGIAGVGEKVSAVNGVAAVVEEREADVAVDGDRPDRKVQVVPRADSGDFRAVKIPPVVFSLAGVVGRDVDVSVDGASRRGAGDAEEGGVFEGDPDGVFLAGSAADGVP